jgi:pimeloyl-ACP methyl ester carboxylesterase
MTERQAVSFRSRSGLRLFGILERPARPLEGAPCIVLLSPGVKMRVGPHCLYRRMTQRFLQLGYPVFRFDFFGLGDSEGSLEETQLADVYNHIEVGRYLNDALDSMDWLEVHTDYRRFILSGLCGGAVTGLLAGARDERVVGLLSLGITPVLASDAANPAQYATLGQLRSLRKGYLRRLLQPKSWLRLLTLQSDYRTMWKSIAVPLRRRLRANAPTPEPQEHDTAADNLNPLFAPSFFEMAGRGRPMLLVFSEADRLYWEWAEKFEPRYAQRLEAVRGLYAVHVVPHANHVLSLREGEREMLAIASQWLQEHFGATPGRSQETLGVSSMAGT